MGTVAVLYKVFPKEHELEKAIENIKKNLKPVKIETQELGFGIKVIKVLFTFEDRDASSDKIEERLKNIDGVSQVEVEGESLI